MRGAVVWMIANDNTENFAPPIIVIKPGADAKASHASSVCELRHLPNACYRACANRFHRESCEFRV